MKTKENKIIFLILTILLIWAGFIIYERGERVNTLRNNYNNTVEKCKENYEEYCQDYVENGFENYNSVSQYLYVLYNSSFTYFSLLAPFFIIIPTAFIYNRYLKKGYIKNLIQRMTYKECIRKVVLKCFKCLYLIPLFLLTIFLGCCIISNFNFDFSNELMNSNSYISTIHMSYLKFPQIVIPYFLIIIIHSLFYLNITIIVSNRCKNLIISIITSFLTFLFTALISEIVIGNIIFSKILNQHHMGQVFNLLGPWIPDMPSVYSILIYSVVIFLVSLVFLIVTFKNRERVVINNE